MRDNLLNIAIQCTTPLCCDLRNKSLISVDILVACSLSVWNRYYGAAVCLLPFIFSGSELINFWRNHTLLSVLLLGPWSVWPFLGNDVVYLCTLSWNLWLRTILTPTLQWYYLPILLPRGLALGHLHGTHSWIVHDWSSSSSSIVIMCSFQIPNPRYILPISRRIRDLLCHCHVWLCHGSHRWQGSFLVAWDVSSISSNLPLQELQC